MLSRLDSSYPTTRWSMSGVKALFGLEGQRMGLQEHACHQLAERWAGARCEWEVVRELANLLVGGPGSKGKCDCSGCCGPVCGRY